MIYTDIEDYESSLINLKKALSTARSINNKQDIASSLVNISLTLQTTEQYNEAIENLEEAVNIASEINNIKLLRTSYGMLSECYEKTGDAEKSFEYFSLFSSFEKHIQKEEHKKIKKETREKIDKMQTITDQAVKEKVKKEKELKETAASLEKVEEINRQKQMEIELKELKLKEKETQLKSERYLRYIIIGGLILVLIITIIIFRNFKQKQAANQLLAKQNKEIRAKNKNIEQSINYAQRIQEAMLPDMNNLSKYLPDSFILFKPRDIVSGDFYWFIDPYKVHLKLKNLTGNEAPASKKMAELKDNNFIIAAVDCTGHGVPGAFMSMIGMNLLFEIVSHGVVEADKILDELHAGIRIALKQDKIDNQDGMDMTICVVKKKDKVVEFAGAKNSLLYIQKGELVRIKGDKFAVGGQQYESIRKYKKHTIKIDQPTIFYIFSDGYQDQFGGPNNMKFLTRNFNNLLLKISNEDFLKQKEILDRTIEDWKENVKQTDDILVIGFKMS